MVAWRYRSLCAWRSCAVSGAARSAQELGGRCALAARRSTAAHAPLPRPLHPLPARCAGWLQRLGYLCSDQRCCSGRSPKPSLTGHRFSHVRHPSQPAAPLNPQQPSPACCLLHILSRRNPPAAAGPALLLLTWPPLAPAGLCRRRQQLRVQRPHIHSLIIKPVQRPVAFEGGLERPVCGAREAARGQRPHRGLRGAVAAAAKGSCVWKHMIQLRDSTHSLLLPRAATSTCSLSAPASSTLAAQRRSPATWICCRGQSLPDHSR